MKAENTGCFEVWESLMRSPIRLFIPILSNLFSGGCPRDKIATRAPSTTWPELGSILQIELGSLRHVALKVFNSAFVGGMRAQNFRRLRARLLAHDFPKVDR